MYSLYSASLPPDHAELSRHAAERYAVLTAVKEQRSQQSSRLAPADRLGPAPLAIDAASGARDADARRHRRRPPQRRRAGQPAARHLRDRLGRTADGGPAAADLFRSRRVRRGRRLAVQRVRARARDRRPAADRGDDPAGPSARSRGGDGPVRDHGPRPRGPAALRVVRRHPAGGRSAAGPVPGRGLHDGHRGRPAGARRPGPGGRHRRLLDLDRPRSAVGRTRRIRSRVARGAADGRWVRAPRHRPAGRGGPERSGQPAVGRERAAARPGSARPGDARAEPDPVRGARRRDGLPDAVARARHRSVRTAGERDPGGVRRGECRGLLPGRPTR